MKKEEGDRKGSPDRSVGLSERGKEPGKGSLLAFYPAEVNGRTRSSNRHKQHQKQKSE